MTITSYFVGLKLNNYFDDLFMKLDKFIRDNNLQNSIILQSHTSLHISLYYFRKNLTKTEIKEINTDLKKFYQPLPDVKINSIKYFSRNNKKLLCYLSCNNLAELKRVNDFFANKYKNIEVADNLFNYLPHISLFKITNSKIYEEYIKDIEKIIIAHVKKSKQVNLIENINLFMVNSNTNPETQIPL